MYLFAIFLLIVCGFLWLSRLSSRLSITERLGFAFPVGLGGVTFLMLLMDWAGIPLTSGTLMTATVVLTLCGAAVVFPQRKAFIGSLKPELRFSWFNVLWLAAIAGVCYLEYANLTKCLYFPVTDRDSMAGFDTIGYIIAQEHTYRGLSIFQGDYMPLIHRPGSVISYMPMLQFSYAYVYALGAETSKIVPALFYLSFLIGFYGLVRRAANHTAAAIAVLGVILTPEMTSFSSLSGTNVVQAAVASTGLMYVCLWTKERDRGLLAVGSLLLGINCWLRTEGLVFVLAAFAVVIIRFAADKVKKETPAAPAAACAVPLLALVPIILFFIYAHAFGLTSETAVIARPYWDGEKAATLWNGACALLTNTQYYAWAFPILLIAVLCNAWQTVRHGDSALTLLAIVLSLLLYFLVLYHVDYKWDSIQNVLNYSAKRFMFCFVPMAWYYFATCGIFRKLFQKIEDTCGFEVKKN